MRKNFGANPWSYPQPVFIIAAYDEAGNPDAMNAAWGGISDTEEVSVCLSASHKTVKYSCKEGIHHQHGYSFSGGCLRLCGPCQRQPGTG